MVYILAAILAGLAALLTAVLRSSRPHPRHEFFFQLVARLEPEEAVSLVPGERPGAEAPGEPVPSRNSR